MHNNLGHFSRRQALVSLAGAVAAPSAFAQTPSYTDDTWQDPRRQRAVPVRIRWPQGTAPVGGWPVVIYSHGLGGSVGGGEVWGSAWANAGFVVLHLQHAGSDIDAVRKAATSFKDRAALRTLASREQLVARLQDVVFVLDDIAGRKTMDKAWRDVRTDGVGMAGHSFGAHTTLGVGGQLYPGTASIKEPRIAALLALSPTLPARCGTSFCGRDPAHAVRDWYAGRRRGRQRCHARPACWGVYRLAKGQQSHAAAQRCGSHDVWR